MTCPDWETEARKPSLRNYLIVEVRLDFPFDDTVWTAWVAAERLRPERMLDPVRAFDKRFRFIGPGLWKQAHLLEMRPPCVPYARPELLAVAAIEVPAPEPDTRRALRLALTRLLDDHPGSMCPDGPPMSVIRARCVLDLCGGPLRE